MVLSAKVRSPAHPALKPEAAHIPLIKGFPITQSPVHGVLWHPDPLSPFEIVSVTHKSSLLLRAGAEEGEFVL